MLRAHPRWNNQLGQLLSDGLRALKTEDTFGHGIEFSDATGGVHGDDTIERRIENCASAIERLRFLRRITLSALILLSFLFYLFRWHRAVRARLTAWPRESKATSELPRHVLARVVTESRIEFGQRVRGVFSIFGRKILPITAHLSASHFERFRIAHIALAQDF